MAQQFHPDKTGGKTQEKFKEISVAYGVLSDNSKKLSYDDARKHNNNFGQTPYDR